ncbi:MAG: hypothetical protein DRI80_12440 [Chloroflexota bacterium]|nr:MAG: hypothetical protein DRI80_12440 [Chloroflexota bacterium]
MWTIAEYQPTAFFSLRPYTATTSGGKSLIVPTPFAVKMALLDAAIRTQGLERGQVLFPAIRDLRIAVRLPRWIVVNNTFTKIWRINDSVAKKGKAEKARLIAEARARRKWPYQDSIAFREYVQFGGPLALAFEGMASEDLIPLLVQVNYLGKRGGFIQLLRPPGEANELSAGFTVLTEDANGTFPLGTLQMVDDCGPSLTLDKANVYERDRRAQIRLGQDRIFHHVVLPYRPVRSSRGFTLYERID